jgi:hypothetical protein
VEKCGEEEEGRMRGRTNGILFRRRKQILDEGIKLREFY